MLNTVVPSSAEISILLGFCVVEALEYIIRRTAGNFTTGFLGLFAIWMYYSWMSKK